VTAGNGTLRLTFLGKLGEFEARSRRHRRHSALLVEHKSARIMIDCGADWLGRLHAVAPTAVVLTHAHLDHAGGLAERAPCPVYATDKTHRLLKGLPIRDRRQIPMMQAVTIAGIRFEACQVQHSLRASAVGYRVSTRAGSFFYLSDVAKLPNPVAALGGVDLYTGDGATVQRSMVRKKQGVLIGHAPITAQLEWCAKARVRRGVFTHCGSAIVRGNARALTEIVRRLGREHGIDACLACDGDRFRLPEGRAISRG
jgi:phosphoribosyl 1,2-cyclic phosphodiesterase